MSREVWMMALPVLGLALVFLYALFGAAKQSDRSARHAEKTLIPYSDVTVTQALPEQRNGPA